MLTKTPKRHVASVHSPRQPCIARQSGLHGRDTGGAATSTPGFERLAMFPSESVKTKQLLKFAKLVTATRVTREF